MTENLAGRGEGLAGLRERIVAAIKRAWPKTKVSSYNGVISELEKLCREIALEAAAPPSTAHVEELRQVLESVERRIGWHGGGPLSHDEYYCEHCKAAPAEDYANINHFHDCLVLSVRRALATPSPQAPQEQCNAFSPTSAREQSSATASVLLRHGVNCEKKPHVRDGYLHGEEDDTPYDVDGVKYCGRCHIWLDAPAAAQARAEYFTDMVAGQAALDGATQEQPAGSEATHEHRDVIEAMQCPECKSFKVPGSGEQSSGLGRTEGEPFNLSQNAGSAPSLAATHEKYTGPAGKIMQPGSPRKVGEDAPGDILWQRCLSLVERCRERTPDKWDFAHELAEICKEFAAARPSSVPVGEQKEQP